MNEDEVSRLFGRADTTIQLNPRPEAQTLISKGQRLLRRQRLLGAAGAAALAALIIGAVVLWLPGNGSAPVVGEETTRLDDGERNSLPAAPDGTRWVGFNGVMVAVLEGWGVNEARCGQPLTGTVSFHDTHGEGACFLLRAVRLSSPVGRGLLSTGGTKADLGGVVARRTSGVCDSSSTPMCSAALVIPGMDRVLLVTGPDRKVVDAILFSARRVPEGFTAVPDVAGMKLYAALDLLRTQRLDPGYPCGPGGRCADFSVERTNPLAGTVVPVGTTVTPALPDGTGDLAPATEELPGSAPS